jgi:aryl-alcohol dehydrogenase-like predicted oxidoreductase
VQTRKLGHSDLQITPIGFGAWAAGGAGWEFAWGAQEDADSIAAIHRSLELGVNWIDTAAVYGLGHSEKVVAQALKQWRGAKPYIFSKCSRTWDAAGKIGSNHSSESIRKECESSLQRLEVDSIDLYQMHWPPSDNGAQLEEAWQTMAQLQKEGKVRWIGVSNFNAAQMRRAQTIAPITSNQPPYSMIRRAIEAETLPFCVQQGIGTISYAPMASGLLTGSIHRRGREALDHHDKSRRATESDHRHPRADGQHADHALL